MCSRLKYTSDQSRCSLYAEYTRPRNTSGPPCSQRRFSFSLGSSWKHEWSFILMWCVSPSLRKNQSNHVTWHWFVTLRDLIPTHWRQKTRIGTASDRSNLTLKGISEECLPAMDLCWMIWNKMYIIYVHFFKCIFCFNLRWLRELNALQIKKELAN